MRTCKLFKVQGKNGSLICEIKQDGDCMDIGHFPNVLS